MKRDLGILSNQIYDIVIIGGGIYGAFAAWEASLRGLSVALIEKNDFGSATSSNSQKIIHGGFRYLQHLDFKRVRESIRERTTLMRIAPTLVHPLPVLIPTYGHGLRGKQILRAALAVYDLLSLDRNRSTHSEKHIPGGHILSKEEVLKELPLVPSEGLTGGAVFYDAQVYNSERLLLSVLHSSDKLGARQANYVKVTGFIQEHGRIIGIKAIDMLTDNTFQIRAKAVLNTTGPWVYQVLGLLSTYQFLKNFPLVKTINLVTRNLFKEYAVGIYGKNQYYDKDALFNKGSRLFFVTPWRNRSVVGTSLSYYDQNPDNLKVTSEDRQNLVSDFNQACPGANLQIKDIFLVHRGFLPSAGNHQKTSDVQISKKYQIIDHSREGLQGLISVIGVKYTTARDVAEKTIDHILHTLHKKAPKSSSAMTVLEPYPYSSSLSTSLEIDFVETHSQNSLLKAQIIYGIREEMAQKLKDIVFRRTEVGTAGHPGKDILEFCADVMGQELGWSPQRIVEEMNEVEGSFPFLT